MKVNWTSLVVLLVPVMSALLTAVTPAMQEVLSHNTWLGPVLTAMAVGLNNVVNPVHKG
jgi:type II secretory pathway component PulF